MNALHSSPSSHAHDALVLQGGAGHALFTLGFLRGASPALGAVTQIGAVSSSAAVACMHLLGRHAEALDYFLHAARGVDADSQRFSLWRLLRGQPPTLHYTLYRNALHDLLTESSWQRLASHPVRLRILVGRGPGRSRLLAGTLAALAMARGRMMPGLSGQVFEVQSCRSRAELLEVLLASAAVPLIAPIPRLAGRACVDGGSVSPIPVEAVTGARNPLVVLTQPELLRPIPGWMRVAAPEQPPALSPWNFGDAEGWRRMYELGSLHGSRLAVGEPVGSCREPHADGTKRA